MNISTKFALSPAFPQNLKAYTYEHTRKPAATSRPRFALAPALVLKIKGLGTHKLTNSKTNYPKNQFEHAIFAT